MYELQLAQLMTNRGVNTGFPLLPFLRGYSGKGKNRCSYRNRYGLAERCKLDVCSERNGKNCDGCADLEKCRWLYDNLS